nr:spore coat protein U domain-containing protein [Lysobacter sp. MMG2]
MNPTTRKRLSSLALQACFAAAVWLLSSGLPLRAQSCTVLIDSTLNFGDVDPASNNPTDYVGTLTVDCKNLHDQYVRACVNFGLVTGSWTLRTMKQGTNSLNFNFYQDAARTYLWTSTSDPSRMTFIADIYNPGGSAIRTYSIYGRIPGGQKPNLGTYSSTFTTNEGTVQVAEFNSTYGPPTCTSSTPPINSRFSFTVVANVGTSCSVSATNIDFGQQGVLSAAVNATGVITTTCGTGTTYSLALSAGSGVGATVGARRMTRSGGNETLAYGLYVDAGRTQPWGDGSSGSSTVAGIGNASAQTNTVYAKLPPQSAAIGTYADTIIVTVTF